MPNEEMCNGCIYWRNITTYGKQGYIQKCCHCLLDTGERRKRDGDNCLSKKEAVTDV